MIKVKPLVGFDALKAFNAYHTLLLGLKMLPDYMAETYEAFYERIEAMPEADQLKMIKAAVTHVPLQKEEVEAMALFVNDPNGVPYGPSNLKSLPLDKVIEIVISVAFEISKIKVTLLSDSEKKNSTLPQ